MNTETPGATLKLTEQERQVIRDAWRIAGGTTYAAPSGQIAAMSELKLLTFLAPFNVAGAPPAARGVLMADMNRLDQVEAELLHLIKAICPGLNTGDLMADAATARAAMATDKPIAFFQGEAGDDGVMRFQNVQDEFQSDEDVFPLYRRAPTVDELKAALQAHADLHQLKAYAAVSSDMATAAGTAKTPTPAVKRAKAPKAETK